MGADPNVDLGSLAAPVSSAVDKFPLLPAFLKVRGLVKQHIDSFDYFINHGIKKIMKANDRIACRHDPSMYLRYTNIYVGRPSRITDTIHEPLTPHGCRLSDSTYAADILVDVEYTIGHGTTKASKKGEQKDGPPTLQMRRKVIIGRMPIMLRSSHCVLTGKDEAELAKLGECPLDPGGYFVVKGTERVILIQEQLSKNRIIIDTDNKGRVMASVTSSTHETKSKTVFFMEKEKIYLQLNQFTKPIPILVVMKAMGMESDQEVVQMLGRDPRYGSLFLPSIEECASERIYTQQQALSYLEGKLTSFSSSRNGDRREGMARTILLDVFLANVPVINGNFRPKCIYASVMLRRMMDAILNTDTFDDKDYVGNKRLELSGQLISLLFEDLFKSMNSCAADLLNKAYENTSHHSHFHLFQPSFILKQDMITNGLEKAISTGNWDLKRFKMHRKGVSQVVSRLSFIAALGHMTRISPQFEKTRKVSGPRALQPSQCYSLGVEDLALLSGVELHAPNSFLVILNGTWRTQAATESCVGSVKLGNLLASL